MTEQSEFLQSILKGASSPSQPNSAVVEKAIEPGKPGRVKYQGVWWSARCLQNITLLPKQTVTVVGRMNLTLLVLPVSSQSFEGGTSPSGWSEDINFTGSRDNETNGIAVVDSLPLLNLFTQLQEAGLPLGIDEYLLLLKSLQQGFGIRDQEALSDLCRTLWVKSPDDEHLFNFYFEQGLKIELSRKNSTGQLSSSGIAGSTLEVDPSMSAIDELTRTSPSETNDSSQLTITSTPVSAELMEIGDEVQVAEAIQINIQQREEFASNCSIQADKYFPVTRRQMKQSWRHLRRFVREGLPTELDVDATIGRVVQQGMLLEPVLVPRRVNRTGLLLLIDQKGSMVPFQALSKRLAETAERGGVLGQANIYYFHNCPTRFLYQSPIWQKAEPIIDVLSRLRPDRSVILVFSDAGAARGGFSMERLGLTEAFLNQLKQRARYITWLNPVPDVRWDGTTSGEIARLVPMFEFSRRGMDQAIDVLRGKLTLSGRRI